MKVILQKDLYLRSYDVFSAVAEKYGIQFIQTNVLDEDTILRQHIEGIKCFVIGAERYSRMFYKSLLKGSAVIRYGVGYNNVPIDVCRNRDIKVGYTPRTLTDSVAEHTFALLLGISRKITTLYQSMIDHSWQGLTGIELKNKKIAIIGFGQIGQAVARIAKKGFGMNVFAFDNRAVEDSSLYDFYSKNFDEVVKNADILSLHLSVSHETIGFINEKSISRMKDGVIFINTSRGELVVEKDLYQALENGKISAAGLDVFVDEPYNPNSGIDIRKLKNTLLTPHCGSSTTDANCRMAGNTLTDNFWANDILWQLNVLAYNLSVMMRQKKSKFKKQEHRTFIDWFIAVPAKITSSRHQIELKMYEHHFYKADREELDWLIEAA